MPPPPPNKLLLWLFLFLYYPFLIQYGVKNISKPAGDFPSIYWATEVSFQEHGSPYGEGALASHGEPLGQTVFPYLYPPPSLLAFSPLALVSYETAKLLMLAVNHVCLLFVITFLFLKLFRQELRSDSVHDFTPILALIYVLTFDPIVRTLDLGQINLVVLVFLCLTWHALKQNAGALTIALPLSLAVVLKTYPILLLPLLLARKKNGAVIWLIVLLSLYSAASYLILPKPLWADWFSKVLPSADRPHAGPWNQNITAFVARAFIPNPFSQPLLVSPGFGRLLGHLISFVVIGITARLSYLYFRAPKLTKSLDILFSLYLFTIFLIAPVSWEHHFVYLVPSLLLLLHLLLSGKVQGTWRWVIPLCLCLIAWRLPIWSSALTKGVLVLGISIKFYAAITIWLFFVIEARRVLSADVQVREQALKLPAGGSITSPAV